MTNRKKLIITRFAFHKYASDLGAQITRDLFCIFVGFMWLLFTLTNGKKVFEFTEIVVCSVIFALAVKSITSYLGYKRLLIIFQKTGYDISKFSSTRSKKAHAS